MTNICIALITLAGLGGRRCSHAVSEETIGAKESVVRQTIDRGQKVPLAVLRFLQSLQCFYTDARIQTEARTGILEGGVPRAEALTICERC